jgi:predicted metal-dependent hydrolase
MSIELPADFYRGIDLFNEHDFFECHEVLEDVWRQQVDPERQLTQGIIQVAVALYHAGRNNFTGAEKLLNRGLARIAHSQELGVDIDVTDLFEQSKSALDAVTRNEQPSLFRIRRRS